MNKIQSTFARLKASSKAALIPYLMAGFPRPQDTVSLMHTLVSSGADILELGIPFSDPMADGPVIQKAGELALEQGVGLEQVFEMVRTFRLTDSQTPIVLMGYANPIEHFDLKHGQDAFVKTAQSAGVDGVLVVDYPPEECAHFAQTLRQAGMDLIFLLAPTSTAQRMERVAELATGYVYYVSLKGITGAAHLDTSAVEKMIPKIREFVKIPVGVGFGVRDAVSAKALSKVSDAVVIGTKLIELLQAPPIAQGSARLASFMQSIRHAMDEEE
jgi:tryptophan synthase alpha chain